MDIFTPTKCAAFRLLLWLFSTSLVSRFFLSLMAFEAKINCTIIFQQHSFFFRRDARLYRRSSHGIHLLMNCFCGYLHNCRNEKNNFHHAYYSAGWCVFGAPRKKTEKFWWLEKSGTNSDITMTQISLCGASRKNNKFSNSASHRTRKTTEIENYFCAWFTAHWSN